MCNSDFWIISRFASRAFIKEWNGLERETDQGKVTSNKKKGGNLNKRALKYSCFGEKMMKIETCVMNNGILHPGDNIMI